MQVLDIVVVLNSRKIFLLKQYSASLIFCPCNNYDDNNEVHFACPLLVDVAIYGLIMR